MGLIMYKFKGKQIYLSDLTDEELKIFYNSITKDYMNLDTMFALSDIEEEAIKRKIVLV